MDLIRHSARTLHAFGGRRDDPEAGDPFLPLSGAVPTPRPSRRKSQNKASDSIAHTDFVEPSAPCCRPHQSLQKTTPASPLYSQSTGFRTEGSISHSNRQPGLDTNVLITHRNIGIGRP